MKKVIASLCGAVLLVGCASNTDDQTTQQTPQFGKPSSTIPWNQPETWEQAGPLGSMPGMIGNP
jgi:hypothetical protein